ncbi:MAG: glycosyltransferase family 9 protein [Candidatus Zixiibacteriota bacterium]
MTMEKLLIISMAGMGNLILSTPLIKNLRNDFPKAKITLLVRREFSRAVLKPGHLINDIVICNLDLPIFKIFKILLKLRRERFDMSLTAFPSNRLSYNLIAFIIAAKMRLTHEYETGKFRTLSFLQNRKVKAIKGIHDVDQNLNLLKMIDGRGTAVTKNLVFEVSSTDRDKAGEFLKENGVREGEKLIGLHLSIEDTPNTRSKNRNVFSSIYDCFGEKYDIDLRKGWDRANSLVFASIGDYVSKEHDAKVILFGGPDELETVKKIKESMNNDAITSLNNSLGMTAELIRRCSLFINTDSGLGHIAAAMGTPSITIFGFADSSRIKPFHDNAVVVQHDLPCVPCNPYPFSKPKPRIKCNREFECMGKIDAQKVVLAIRRLMAEFD